MSREYYYMICNRSLLFFYKNAYFLYKPAFIIECVILMANAVEISAFIKKVG
jgi:hypothetical protein